jgi:hypothetical protein
MSAARRWHVLVRLALVCPAFVPSGSAYASAGYTSTARRPAATTTRAVQSRRVTPDRALTTPRAARYDSHRLPRVRRLNLTRVMTAPLYLVHRALLI